MPGQCKRRNDFFILGYQVHRQNPLNIIQQCACTQRISCQYDGTSVGPALA